MFVTWPNFISLGRLLAAPVVAWLILSDKMVMAFWISIAAGASDFFDGLLARSLKWQSSVGAYLDPLADKVLLVTLFTVLGMRGWIPLWLMIGVIFRDVMILGGTFLLWMFKKNFTIKPMAMSKVNTALQIGLVVLILAEKAFAVMSFYGVTPALVYLTGLTTGVSGALYVVFWVRLMNTDGEKDTFS